MNSEGCGWVVKAPFTTNGAYVKFGNTLEDIVAIIESAKIKFENLIPYVMLQPKMMNRK